MIWDRERVSERETAPYGKENLHTTTCAEHLYAIQDIGAVGAIRNGLPHHALHELAAFSKLRVELISQLILFVLLLQKLFDLLL